MIQTWKMNTGISLIVYFCMLFTSTVVVGADEEQSQTNNVAVTEVDVDEENMLASVEGQLKKAKQIEMTLRSMIDSARKEKDTVKILCIDDKIAQIQALLKGAQNRVRTLKSTLEARDSGGAKHQFVILQVSFNKLQGLRVQAEACVGNSDFVVGPSESEVSVSEEFITPEDATTPEQEIFTPDNPFPPTVASGFR